MDNYDLKKIKKHYGERFAKLCRELFPEFLDEEGLLYNTLKNTIEPNDTIFEDIYPIKNHFRAYIYDTIMLNKKLNNVEYINTNKTVKELFEKAGYDFYECKTEEEIQSFKKYYALDEELCTFRGGRLNSCYVFFVVKKDIEKYKREDFINPKREDAYSTSVMSIQLTRGERAFVSIKSRYNHGLRITEQEEEVLEKQFNSNKVDEQYVENEYEKRNPDAVYDNNLEKIMPGLTRAFEKDYNLNIVNSGTTRTSIEYRLSRYISGNDDKLYKYDLNFSTGNSYTYFCKNNIVIDNGEVKKFNKDKYIFADNYIIDLENKKIFDYFDKNFRQQYSKTATNEFPDLTLQNIKKIEMEKIIDDKDTFIKLSFITDKPYPVEMVLKNNNIISYVNKNETIIRDTFLFASKQVKNVEIPNVTAIGDCFLEHLDTNFKLDIKNVKLIGNNFLLSNSCIEQINLPNVVKIGNKFLYRNQLIKQLELKNLKELGNRALYFDTFLDFLDIRNIRKIGENCLYFNNNLKNVIVPKKYYGMENYEYLFSKIATIIENDNDKIINAFVEMKNKQNGIVKNSKIFKKVDSEIAD